VTADHSFELITEGFSLADHGAIDRLYETCPDATVSGTDEVTRIGFDRERASFGEALLSAVRDVESVPGVRVVRVEPDELVWASEIAQRTGRSRQSITMLIAGQRGPGDFPRPLTHPTRNPLWRWSEVAEWFARWERRDLTDAKRSTWIAAVNGVLEARRGAERLSADERQRLADLLQPAS
jgi:predicted DNA-binding transcriptional regulator AlpA